MSSEAYQAEVELLGLLLQSPNPAILATVPSLKASDFTRTNTGARLFKALQNQIYGSGFSKEKLIEEFGPEIINGLLAEAGDPKHLQSYVSFIKAGVDLSNYHISNQVEMYAAEAHRLAKIPLHERVFKPRLPTLAASIGGHYKGELSVLAARPGIGKSSLAFQECIEFGTPQEPSSYIYLEMTRDRLIDRSVVAYDDQLLYQEVLELTFMSDSIKKKAWLAGLAELNKHNMYLIGSDDKHNYSDYAVLRPMLINLLKLGVRYIVIDSINLLYWSGNNKPRNYELEDIVKDILALCTNESLGNPHIQLIAHLNRAVESTADKRGRLNHLRDTGGLEQWAHMVTFIYRDVEGDNPDIADVYTLKNRNANVPSSARLRWLGGRFKYVELDNSLI